MEYIGFCRCKRVKVSGISKNDLEKRLFKQRVSTIVCIDSEKNHKRYIIKTGIEFIKQNILISETAL